MKSMIKVTFERNKEVVEGIIQSTPSKNAETVITTGKTTGYVRGIRLIDGGFADVPWEQVLKIEDINQIPEMISIQLDEYVSLLDTSIAFWQIRIEVADTPEKQYIAEEKFDQAVQKREDVNAAINEKR